MTLANDDPFLVPNCPPVAYMATVDQVLTITVLHVGAADFFWQHRQRLTAVFRCTSLHILLLDSRSQHLDVTWPATVPPLSTG